MPILSPRSMTRALAVLAAVGIANRASLAQAPAAHTSCSVRHTAMSPADLAFLSHDMNAAIDLYTKDSATPGPEQDRAHDGLIRSLLAAQKVSDADANAKAWAAAAPTNPWSLLATAQVDYRKGDIAEAAQALIASQKADPCNARARADTARLLTFNSQFATAKTNLNIAHSLEPENDEITNAWLQVQPRATRLSSITEYLKIANIDAEERKRLERRRDSLSNPVDSPCHLVTPLTSTTIPYRAIQDGPDAPVIWGLNVSFNGTPRRMEIDTGASGLVLNKSAAAALNLIPEQHLKSGGIGDEGSVDTLIAKVKSIRIGGLEFQDCDVEVLNKNPGAMQASDGLIGGDVFADFVLTLDFPGHQLRLDPLPHPPQSSAPAATASLATTADTSDEAPQDRFIDPSMANWSRVYRSDHDLILPVRLNKGPSHLFIMDTGSSLDLISPQAAAEVGKVYQGSNVEISGVSGKVKKVDQTGPITMEFANVRKPSRGMTSVETSSHAFVTGVEISGFIGAPTLHQLTIHIDYRDNLVRFDYDPSRLTHCVQGTNIPDCVY